jgi:hypothetical protein
LLDHGVFTIAQSYTHFSRRSVRQSIPGLLSVGETSHLVNKKIFD